MLDHILTLHQSLAHYERVLSHSHPTYLSQLRVSLFQAKGGSDAAILNLSIITMIVLCFQVLLGMSFSRLKTLCRSPSTPLSSGIFSMNCTVPANGKEPPNDTKFNLFFIILASAFVVAFGVLALVYHWKQQAKVKFNRRL